MKAHPWWDGLTAEESEELANLFKSLSDSLPKGIEKEPEDKAKHLIQEMADSARPLFGDFNKELRMWELLTKAVAKAAEDDKQHENPSA